MCNVTISISNFRVPAGSRPDPRFITSDPVTSAVALLEAFAHGATTRYFALAGISARRARREKSPFLFENQWLFRILILCPEES